jgi:hypothetical protein
MSFYEWKTEIIYSGWTRSAALDIIRFKHVVTCRCMLAMCLLYTTSHVCR